MKPADELPDQCNSRILDAHIHLWDPRTTPRAVSPIVHLLGFSPKLVDWVCRRVFPRNALEFFASPEYITRQYMPAQFKKDHNQFGVAGFVHVEASWHGRGLLGPVEETRWLEDLRNAGAPVKGIVAHTDLSCGDEAAKTLDAHIAASNLVRGIRDTLAWHPNKSIMNLASGPTRSRDVTWRRGFKLLYSRSLAFEATCYAHQLDEVAELAADFPEQTIILCHVGTPVAAAGTFAGLGRSPGDRESEQSRWKRGIERLAEYTNVFVKLSGLGMPVCGFGYERRSESPASSEVARDFRPWLNFVIDAFGADRCMFASNFPIDKVSMDYGTLVDAYREALSYRSDAEREAIFHDTAAKLYQIELHDIDN